MVHMNMKWNSQKKEEKKIWKKHAFLCQLITHGASLSPFHSFVIEPIFWGNVHHSIRCLGNTETEIEYIIQSIVQNESIRL